MRRSGLYAMAIGCLLAATGCGRMQAQGDVPTYPDNKLDAMRGITGAELPHDPHRWSESRSAGGAAMPPLTAPSAATPGAGASAAVPVR